jgi:hypothetical protein
VLPNEIDAAGRTINRSGCAEARPEFVQQLLCLIHARFRTSRPATETKRQLIDEANQTKIIAQNWPFPAAHLPRDGRGDNRPEGFDTLLDAFQEIVCTDSFCAANARVKVEKTEYAGWKNCYRVSNGEIELIVTGDVGPRIIRFGFVGGQNLFKEFPDPLGKSREEKFELRGGDRVWKAPEDAVATWAPDNLPVEIQVTSTGLIAREPVEPLTQLQKEIEVSVADTGANVTVSHRITNRSLFSLEFSPWALTMMAQGGVAVSGFPPRGRHPINLEATNPLVMWAYTNLADPRWKFTKKYLTLRQDASNSEAQKLGLFNTDTWGAYLLHGEAFVKRTKADAAKTYPDFGCSFETFTNNEFLELETLGPMTKVASGKMVEQVEHWGLFRNVQLKDLSDEELDRALLPLIQAVEAGR